MEFLKSIAIQEKAALKEDVQYALAHAHFMSTFIVGLKPIMAKWTKHMDKRFLDYLKPEVDALMSSLSGGAYRAKQSIWYVSGDTYLPVPSKPGEVGYAVTVQFRFFGEKWTSAGRRRNENLYGDTRFVFQFPGKRYSDAAFDASVTRELAGYEKTVRIMSDLVLDPSKLDAAVERYNAALAELKAVCETEYTRAFPLSIYFQSHQY